jgi:hypothetical protein
MSASPEYSTLTAGIETAVRYADQRRRREIAIHKALGVRWGVWDDATIACCTSSASRTPPSAASSCWNTPPSACSAPEAPWRTSTPSMPPAAPPRRPRRGTGERWRAGPMKHCAAGSNRRLRAKNAKPLRLAGWHLVEAARQATGLPATVTCGEITRPVRCGGVVGALDHNSQRHI